jgi:hypothetical protein
MRVFFLFVIIFALLGCNKKSDKGNDVPKNKQKNQIVKKDQSVKKKPVKKEPVKTKIVKGCFYKMESHEDSLEFQCNLDEHCEITYYVPGDCCSYPCNGLAFHEDFVSLMKTKRKKNCKCSSCHLYRCIPKNYKLRAVCRNGKCKVVRDKSLNLNRNQLN